jgi:hypothetical protein
VLFDNRSTFLPGGRRAGAVLSGFFVPAWPTRWALAGLKARDYLAQGIALGSDGIVALPRPEGPRDREIRRRDPAVDIAPLQGAGRWGLHPNPGRCPGLNNPGSSARNNESPWRKRG